MFKGASDSRHYLDRTGSHSTKPSRSTLGVKGQDRQPESAACLDHTVRLRELGLKRTRLLEENERLYQALNKGTAYQREEAGRRKSAVQDQIALVKDEIRMLWKQESPGIMWEVALELLPEDLYDTLKAKVDERHKEIEKEIGFDPGNVRIRDRPNKQNTKPDLPEPIHHRKLSHKSFRGWA